VITHRDSSILPNTPDIRDLNLIHPSPSPSFSSSSSSSSNPSKSESMSKAGTPHFQPEEGYTMATHVIRPPVPSSSRTSNSGRRIGGEVYQSTNPCLDIKPDLVLGIARLERYVVPFSSSRSSYLLHWHS
jgi:hypothetical protein